MVREQLYRRGIRDSATLRAMGVVPRERFVSASLKSSAYSDGPLPIGEGQTISQPYVVALMTEAAQLKDGDKVLEIGTGSGYQAAVLAEIVKEVYTIERVESLGLEAERALAAEHYSNIHLRIGDGSLGWPEEAPFDAILVTAASPSAPPSLLKQLAEGGRLIIPIGLPDLQTLLRYTKQNGKVREESLEVVCFVPLLGKEGWPTRS